jgi:hypothetical protein
MVAAQASLLAFLTKRPVKLIYDREEDIISTSKRHPGIVDYKFGSIQVPMQHFLLSFSGEELFIPSDLTGVQV